MSIILTEQHVIHMGFIKDKDEWFKINDKGDKLVIDQHKEYGSNKHLSFTFSCGGFPTKSSINLELKYLYQLDILCSILL